MGRGGTKVLESMKDDMGDVKEQVGQEKRPGCDL